MPIYTTEQVTLVTNLRTISDKTALLDSEQQTAMAKKILQAFSDYTLAHPRPSLNSFLRTFQFGTDNGRDWIDAVERKEKERGYMGSPEFIAEVLQYLLSRYEELKTKKEEINGNSRVHFLLTRFAELDVARMAKGVTEKSKPSAAAIPTATLSSPR